MNRNSRRLTKKQAQQKARRLMTSVHILIAVVAVIECILLVTFTTFSWIESNSSLIIQNGPASTQETNNKRLSIADQLTYKIDLNSHSNSDLDLKCFFSEVKYFEFAKTTSPDGKSFYFPYRNNTNSDTLLYRKGDTIDYNTSYLYFDFVLSNYNNGTQNTEGYYQAENREVYFSDETGYGLNNIFNITGDNLTQNQKNALRNAMRISITYGTGAGANTAIYSYTEHHYDAQDSQQDTSYRSIPVGTAGAQPANFSDQNYLNNAAVVETKALSDYVYETETLDGGATRVKSKSLFTARKNTETKVSVRIWFEERDADFIREFGSDYTTDTYKKIPDASIGVKFAFKTSANDLQTVIFDDYTFSKKAGANHLTEEFAANSNYSVWFYAWQPAVSADATSGRPARAASWVATELQVESYDSSHVRWSTNLATKSMLEYLMNNDPDSEFYFPSDTDRYTKAYFCYGDFSTMTAVYKWELNAPPATDAYFNYCAYSYMPNVAASHGTGSWNFNNNEPNTTWQDCIGTPVKGVGMWQDDDSYTAMELLEFRDKTTAVTASGFNQPGYSTVGNETVISTPNSEFISFAATGNNAQHSYYVYVNNLNSNTPANNYGVGNTNQTVTIATGEHAVSTVLHGTDTITAVMYYDTADDLFKSYVPRYWLTGDASNNNKGTAYYYIPSGGGFSYSNTAVRWYDSAPSIPRGSNVYCYTALGYSASAYTGLAFVPGVYAGSANYLPGVGTWGDIEQIKFSAELLDTSLTSDQRFFVGIGSGSQDCYVMIPDDTNMMFSAYVPKGLGNDNDGDVTFFRYNAYKPTSTATNASDSYNAHWSADHRDYTYVKYDTYYPVDAAAVGNNNALSNGYWNLSVLVDGTYENIIYDTLTDGAHNNDSPVASYLPTVTPDPDDGDNDIIDYSPRHNYGVLEYSYDNETWEHVIFDDTLDREYNKIDRYRFYAPAQGYTHVYWRWTPYAAYSITATVDGTADTPVTGNATVFVYDHAVADASVTGIYKVVTEAEDAVDYSTLEP